jgi:hypothetical protein
VQLYHSDFTTIFLNKRYSLLSQIWQNTGGMTDEIYQHELQVFTDFVKNHQVAYILSDIRKLDFPVTPELQQWTKKSDFGEMEQAGIEKHAIIINKELLSKLSVVTKEHNLFGFTTQYFDDATEAREWLNPELTLQVF